MNSETGFKETEIGEIPQDWEATSFRNILCGSIKHGIYKSKEFLSDGGVRILKMGVLNSNDRIGSQEMERITVTDDELKRFRINEGNLIFSRTSMMTEGMGKCSLAVNLDDDDPIVFDGNLICAELNTEIAYPEFYFYFFKSRIGQEQISRITTGTQSRNISASNLTRVSIPLPPLPEQVAIADTLSKIDSGIELNYQTNRTLEAIGQAVFKHWFVDFEFPNEEGKPYKSSGREMEDSVLGNIPRGWKVGMLGDVCQITMGQSPPGETYNELGDGMPFYQGIRDFGFRFPTRRVYCRAPSRFAEKGDVLLSVRAPVGSLNVTEERCAIGRGIAALHARETHYGCLYYLLHASKLGWREFETEGTVFGSVTRADVNEFKIIVPPESLRDQFCKSIEPLDLLIEVNEEESRNLASIRDCLLPRLMLGEIRVSTDNQSLGVNR